VGERGRRSSADLATTPLRVVQPTPPAELGPPPPSHLSEAMQAWWREIVSEFDLGPHHVKQLELCCDAYDRLAAARALLLKEGIAKGTRWAVGIERDSRIAFCRILREMDLDAPDPPTQPYHPPPAIRSNRRR
jgi:phage terminase small subunit